ncbi:MAG: outer membrane homotrimeric porin [Deltaproteobacteria bacterium]|jgi:hypothetical protein|nr:outer membrane homotrimeric porin [Deltaproteobacteria bacterium]
MKRLVALLPAAILFFSSFSSARAIDVKASGTWEIGIGWADNLNFSDAKQGEHTDMFSAAQRIRPQFEFISSDDLKAVLGMQIFFTWGSPEDGGRLDADEATARIRYAYLDWSPIPKAALRMGMQGVALPGAAFGNPVLDTSVAGVVGSYTFTEKVGLTAFWLRPFDQSYSDGQDAGRNVLDDMDIFGFSLPITGEGFSVTPWAMYARTGNASGYWEYRAEYNGNESLGEFFDEYGIKGSSNLWWVGAALELDLMSPFALKLDAMYGAAKGGNAPEFSGYLFAGLLEYASEQWWGKPGLIAWYGSGDDADAYKKGNTNNGDRMGSYGRMPIISADNAGFAPAGFGFSGSMGCMQDGLLSQSGVGTWGLGLQLDGVSFMDKLSHTLRAVYVRGSNDADMIRKSGRGGRLGRDFAMMGEGVYLTERDYAVEFDFVSAYEVHENLTLFLETNYVILDLDSDVWSGGDSRTTNAWKVQALFEYRF